jgi:hypothetical protein
MAVSKIMVQFNKECLVLNLTHYTFGVELNFPSLAVFAHLYSNMLNSLPIPITTNFGADQANVTKLCLAWANLHCQSDKYTANPTNLLTILHFPGKSA